MALRLLVNGKFKGVIRRASSIAYVMVNWASGPAADGLWLAATTTPQFQSLRSSDSIDVFVDAGDGNSEVVFDGSVGLTDAGMLDLAGIDVFVNALPLHNFRVARSLPVNLALVEIYEDAARTHLTFRADGNVLAEFPLTVGDHVRVDLIDQKVSANGAG